MRIVSWNLFHGRSLPNSGRDLQTEFAAALASWEWDVALLQEVPPWWPPGLARACGAEAASALTSRNSLLPVRRFIAVRWPDLIKSDGGGANAILVRGQSIAERRELELRRTPERRVVQAVRLQSGDWVANLHAQVHSEADAQADLAKAFTALDGWTGAGVPAILGGDTNTREPLAGDLRLLAISDVDAVLARGWRLEGHPEVPDRGPLSDHAPLIADLARV